MTLILAVIILTGFARRGLADWAIKINHTFFNHAQVYSVRSGPTLLSPGPFIFPVRRHIGPAYRVKTLSDALICQPTNGVHWMA